MATHAVATGKIGTAEFTLAASTVDTVNFADDLNKVEVISDGAAAVWYTLDGSTPTVGGDGCFYIPASASVDVRSARAPGATSVKLISSGTPKLRVQRGHEG